MTRFDGHGALCVSPMTRLPVAACALLVACGGGAPDSLGPGFADPIEFEGRFGGPVELGPKGRGCVGYAERAPDHALTLTEDFDALRIIVHGGDIDTTLAVELANGEVRCNDDEYGPHPVVEGAMPAGPLRIWVGSYDEGVTGPYRLGITRQSNYSVRAMRPPSGAAPAAAMREAAPTRPTVMAPAEASPSSAMTADGEPAR